MALPADFSKIFGSTATGGLTPIGDVNYAKGWEFVGSNPPTKNDFSYLQNLSDLKSQWLYTNKLQRTDPFGDIKSDGAAAISTALTNLGIKSAALRDVGAGTNQIPDMGSFGILKNAIGYQYLPGGLILQWGKVGPTSAGQATDVTFPITHSTATVAVMCTLDATSLPGRGFGCSAIAVERTGFGFYVTQDSGFNSNTGGFWFALGY